MRIIGGSAKGRRLVAPDGATRPTSDRAREGIFSTLESLLPGGLHDKRVLDLYAGSGAIGMEASSRGASDVILVDQHEKAIRACRSNITALDLQGVVAVRTTSSHYLASGDDHFDLIFADPPYQVSNAEIEDLIAQMIPRLAPEGIVAVERSSRTAAFQWPAELEGLRERTYGEAIVYYARLSGDR